MRKTVVVLQTPDNIFERAATAWGIGEEHLGVEAVDERRMQVVLRLGPQEMFEAVHAAKIQNKV